MILGLDTSTAACSVCVITPADEVHEITAGASRLFEQPAHARELLPAVAEVMTAAGADWGDIAAIAVGVGPGAFTGLRIGVSTARALASARGIPLVPVSSLEAVAFELLNDQVAAGFAMPVFDAKRGELFVAAYQRSGGDRPLKLMDRRSIKPSEIAEVVAAIPGEGGVAAGDGAVSHAAALSAAGVDVADSQSRSHMVRARSICKLARLVRGENPTAVEPDYVREPDIDKNVLATIAARGA